MSPTRRSVLRGSLPRPPCATGHRKPCRPPPKKTPRPPPSAVVRRHPVHRHARLRGEVQGGERVAARLGHPPRGHYDAPDDLKLETKNNHQAVQGRGRAHLLHEGPVHALRWTRLRLGVHDQRPLQGPPGHRGVRPRKVRRLPVLPDGVPFNVPKYEWNTAFPRS